VKNYLLILSSVFLNASAQLLIKKDLGGIGQVSLNPDALAAGMVTRAVRSAPVLAGILCICGGILILARSDG
jgi:hypothetical protein